MEKKKAFITGAGALLGRSLTEALLEEGYEVYSLFRKESKNLEGYRAMFPSVHIVYGSMEDFAELDIPKTDVFFHFAWDSSTPQGRNDPIAQKKNFDMSVGVLHKAIESGTKRFIFSGSQAEYGKQHKGEIKETAIVHPVSEYGKWKASFGDELREIASKANLSYCHLRIFSVYGGKYPKSGLLYSLMKSIKNNEDFRMGPCTQLWNFLHIDDFKKIMAKLVEMENMPKILNVGSSDTRPLKEFVIEAHEVLNGKNKLYFGENNPNPEGMVDLNPSVSLIEDELGIKGFISFKDGMIDSFNYL